MTDTTTAAGSARLSADEAKIVLRHDGRPELVEFCHSLPHRRYDAATKSWTCDATPAAAWRICERDDIDSNALETLAARLNPPIPSLCPLEQPGIRRTDAWNHQLEAYEFADFHSASLLAMDMGTGKTKVAIDLMQNWDCKRVLVLCPKSVLDVWRSEFLKHAAVHPNLLVLDTGSVKQKTEAARQWLARYDGDDRACVVVINYESARAWPFGFRRVVDEDTGKSWIEEGWSLKQTWDLVVLDESHRVKAPGGVTSRYAEKLGRRAARRLCLTGTPMPHSPLDVYGQCRFLDAGLFGTSFARFRSRYAVMGGWEQKEVVGWQNEDELRGLLRLIMHQVDSSVLDLPETQDHQRWFDLSPKARKHYDELQTQLITEIADGVVTAANALVRLLRLQQVTSGFLRVEKERYGLGPIEYYEQIDAGKAELLAELLEDIGPREPVVVFCKFRHDLDAVHRVAGTLGRKCGEISGRRNDYAEWKANKENTLAVQIQAGSLGIDLTEARYAVYYSTGFSLGDYNQSRARLHRPGQTRCVHYYHLLARGTVDAAIMGALKKKQDVVDSILVELKQRSEAWKSES